MDPLQIWYDVLVKPNYVRIFKYNKTVMWTDGVGMARVPPTLTDEVEPGKVYSVYDDDIQLLQDSYNAQPMLDALANAEKNCRVMITSDVTNAEIKRVENKRNGEILNCRMYYTKPGDLVLVQDRIHPILKSAHRRGATLATEARTKRTTVAAKLDGNIVAWVAVVALRGTLANA